MKLRAIITRACSVALAAALKMPELPVRPDRATLAARLIAIRFEARIALHELDEGRHAAGDFRRFTETVIRICDGPKGERYA